MSNNHLADLTTYSFSKDDLELFFYYDLDILRGCDEIYTYELNRTPEHIDDVPKNWANIINYQHCVIIDKAKEKI